MKTFDLVAGVLNKVMLKEDSDSADAEEDANAVDSTGERSNPLASIRLPFDKASSL